MTLVFILLLSSVDKSPFHILFNVCPYSGSSLKWWLLSNIIIALMQLSQCLLDKLESIRLNSVDPTGSSWQKSPANMIENSPKSLALFPISFSFKSSVSRILSLVNDTWSTIRICTYCHSFLLLRLNAFLLIEKHGLWDCDTTKHWCCCSCVCRKQECCITPHDTHC